ncbi:MAG TPA: putative nucleotidyltransferase substrate binding domain-containing protein [Geminicoccaceae bacterium]|nr:putative nucleotidyltransferase substrate binding domain-containing protein [Geminicoccaceae bacterium]
MAHSQTAAFRGWVRDHMQAPPVVVSGTQPALEVVARMTEARASAAVILEGDGRVAGILTEQDVTRRIAGQGVGAQPVAQFMTRPVATISADQPLYEAIGFMRRLGLRHMPVVDGGGGLAGMLYLHDALAAADPSLVEHIDQLTHETTLDGLREVKAAQVRLAADLFADRVPAPEIQSLISHVNNDIYRRVVQLNLDAMRSEDWGAPPVAFAVIVMGSGGRGESYLSPDQDNGFVLADYPDHEHGRIDPFFIELAARMTTQMDQLGFPLCRGGVMATNPVWRKTRRQWRHQVARWIRTRSEIAMRLCDVLFDFQSVHGEAELAEALRAVILGEVRQYPGFLRDMFGVQADHRAGLGWFNRLLTERDDPEHRGAVNLKYAGTLPLAEAVRLLALREGIAATGTLARIDALDAAGRLSRDAQDRLRGAFDHITGLQLRQQIADYEAGRPVSNFVNPAELTAREIDLLKDGFRAINDFRALVRAELTGDVF